MDRAKYVDCYEALDRAEGDPVGIRLKCISEGQAIGLRNRLNFARALDRKENNGDSKYDPFVISTKEAAGFWWVYIEKMGQIESLSEVGHG